MADFNKMVAELLENSIGSCDDLREEEEKCKRCIQNVGDENIICVIKIADRY